MVAAELPVLIVAGLLVVDDALLTWLRDYAPLAAIWLSAHELPTAIRRAAPESR